MCYNGQNMPFPKTGEEPAMTKKRQLMLKVCQIGEKCRNIDRNNRKHSRLGACVHISIRLSMNVFVALSQVFIRTHRKVFTCAKIFRFASIFIMYQA